MNPFVVKDVALCGLVAFGLVAGALADVAPTICATNAMTSYTETMFCEAIGRTPNSPLNGKYYYEDNLAPHVDANYDCRALMSPPRYGSSTNPTNHIFYGKSCAVGHVSLYCYSPDQITFPYDGLILKADCDFRDRTQGANGVIIQYIINGKVRVDGTSSKPSKIQKTSIATSQHKRVAYLFTGAFSSKDANSYLELPHYNSCAGLLDLQLGGDVSGYTGTIMVDPTLGTNWLSFVGANQTFPGTIRLTKNAELRVSGSTTSLANVKVEANTSVLEIAATNALTVGKLTMAAGLTLPVKTTWSPRSTGHLTVTDASALAGALAVKVTVPTITYEMLTNSTGKCAVLTVPVDCENYTVDYDYPELSVRDRFGTLPEFTRVTETNGATKTVYLAHQKVIVNIKDFSDKKDLETNGEYWSDGEPLTNSAAIYWFGNNLGTRFNRDQKSYTNAFKDISFVSPYGFTLGGSFFMAKRLQLVAGSSSPLYVTYGGRADVVRDLVGGKTYDFGNVSTFMAESIEFVREGDSSEKCITIQSYDGHFLNFRGPMSGNSDIKFKARGVNSLGKAAAGGCIYFENGLANFTGKMMSAKDSSFNDWADRTWDYGSAWVVSKTSNLGAPRESFTFDAISLRYLNGIYTLSDGNVTLDELTRGIYVAGGTAADAIGFIVTPGGRTLTVKQALRMNGTLKKVGAGTLVLSQDEAQKLTFGSDATGSDTPVADCNVFKVQAGALKVTTKFAADGFALSFTNGTSLVVTPGATVETNSLYNVKGTVASACTGDLAGKIPVAFDTTGVSEGQALTGVICTVASSSALTTDSFVMTAARPFGNAGKGYVLTVTEETVEGNKVFTATARPRGAILFLR